MEGETVLHLIRQLITESSGRSIGVVTFNYPQQQLIQELVETELQGRIGGKDVDEPLIIKNIENIQGDERDIVIFSTAYAPDERGRLSMQFGSLNTRGGANRLNVAVTRARERVYVVTSLWPDQLTIAETANDGPRLLKAYLDYALTVSEGRFHPSYQFFPTFAFNTLLKSQLAIQHPTWQPELPFADLTVKTDGDYKSLILTDDDAYYQQSEKQAHAFLPIALRSRNWPFQRFWSRGFWQKTAK